MKDYYNILGVEKTATAEDIKRAYRQSAIKHHPDKNPGDPDAEQRFKDVQEAYSTLIDENKRSQYDNPAHVNSFSNFDPFGNMRRNNRNAPAKGQDLQVEFYIELEDVLVDKKAEIRFQRDNACKKCNGQGLKANGQHKNCKKCNGHGHIREVFQHGNAQIFNESTCAECRGDGKVILKEDQCDACDGQGRVIVTADVEVTIPAGIIDGMVLRIPHEGYMGKNGGPRGYVYARVRVKPHKIFNRHESNPMLLYRQIDVSFVDACLGYTLNVEMIDGRLKSVQIPAGCPSGHLISLPAEGLPSMEDKRGRGELHLLVCIIVPNAINEEQKSLLERFSQIEKEKV